MEYEFKLYQDGVMVAAGQCSDWQILKREAFAYAYQYADDNDNLKLVMGPKRARRSSARSEKEDK